MVCVCVVSLVTVDLCPLPSTPAGYVWAYNTQLYYQSVGETTATIGSYMSWIPLLGGSVGVILGGFISDRIVRRIGPRGRLIVLTISQVISVV